MNYKSVLLTFLYMTIAISCMEKENLQQENPVFTSQMEVFNQPVKTSLAEGNTIVWSENDCISIFQGTSRPERYVLSSNYVGSNNGEFSYYPDHDNNTFISGNEIFSNIAVYPYSAQYTCSGSGLTEDEQQIYRISGATLPATQEYSCNSVPDESFFMMAATNGTDDKNLKFKNVSGALKLKLYGTGMIQRLTLRGNSGEPLAGTATIVGGGNIKPYFEFGDGASTSITLDCGSGVLLNSKTPTDFIFSVPPVLFENGFTILVEDTEGGTQTLEAKHANEVLRSSILTMPEVEIKLSHSTDIVIPIDEAFNRTDIVTIKGTATATSSTGVILTDNTGNVFVYIRSSRINVGDIVSITGSMVEYGHFYEFIPESFSIHDQTYIEYGEALKINSRYVLKLLDAIHMEGIQTLESEYVEVEGYLLNKSRYFRISDSDELLRLYNPNSDINNTLSGLTYQKVRIRGYSNSFTSSNYLNIVPVSLEVIGNENCSVQEALGSDDGILTGVVTATSSRGYVLNNGNDNIFVYDGEYGQRYIIGDNVSVTGLLKTFDYGKEIFQLYDTYNYTTDYTFPTPEVLTAEEIDQYINSSVGLRPFKDNTIPSRFIQVQGTLKIEGTAYNIYVDGARYGINLYNPDNRIIAEASELDGHEVVMTGYTLKITSGNLLGVVASSLTPIITK